MKLLLVEDDPNIAKQIILALNYEGHKCDHVIFSGDCEQMLKVPEGSSYDMVIIDIILPGDKSGIDLLLYIRNILRRAVPILVLSAISAVQQKVKALRHGADGYMVKPIDPTELMAKINAIIRRYRGHPQSLIKVAKNIAINLDHRNVEVRGKPLHLTNKEYAMMELLALRKGTVLTKEMFLNHLYSGLDEPSDHKIVDVFMCKLRKKLADANGGDSYIETVWGRGYVLKDSSEEDGDEENYVNSEEDTYKNSENPAIASSTERYKEERGEGFISTDEGNSNTPNNNKFSTRQEIDA